MNPETDDQLLNRVIEHELGSDEFVTESEFLAYARHLSDRELVDTEANRATWIAARTYYRAGRTGETSEAREQTIAYSDLVLRQQALSYASQNVNGENTASTMARAKAYLKFLQSGGEE